MTRFSSISTLFFALGAVVSAQNLIPASLPACATSCANLQSAASSCETNPATQQSCFCASGILAPVKTNPSANLCAPTCSDADWALIAQWYATDCANEAAPPASQTATLVTSAAPATQATQASQASQAATNTGPSIVEATGNSQGATSSSGGSGITLTDGNDDSSSVSGQEWWKTHYQWIIMLIVLLVVFLVLGLGGTFWYRRRQRTKSRNMGAFAGGSAQQWAPNSSTHDFNDMAERQARGALASQPGAFGGAKMVERGNSRRSARRGRGKGLAGVLGRS